MRWKGLAFLVVLLGIIFVLSLIFTDKWLERGLENLGSSIVVAKVEIDDLDFSFTGLHIRWDSLQIADPKDTWKNLVQTGKGEFDLVFLPLLSKKVMIQNWQLSDVQTGTERTTDGKIDKPKKKKEKPPKPGFITKTVQKLEGEISTAPAWNLDQYTRKVNVDSIIQLLRIQSPAKIDSLKDALEQKYEYWEKTFSNVDLEKDFSQLEAKVKSIDPNAIKTLTDLQMALMTVNQVKGQVDSLKQFVTASKDNLTKDLDAAQSSIKQVDDWVKTDYSRAMAQAKLPDFSTQNIGKFVFGKKVVGQVTRLLNLVGQARYYASKVKSDKPKKEKPPRLKGQDIHFPLKHPVPEFWIKKIQLSGITPQKIQLSGNIDDIVSNQRLIGKTTDIAFSGTRKDGAALDFDGVLNYLEEIPSEAFKLKMTQIPLANVKLSDSPFLPYKLKSGVGRIESTLKLDGDSIDGQIKFTGSKLVFDFEEEISSSNKLQETIRSIVRGASTIDFVAKIKGQEDRLDFSLNSNLDDLFVRQLRSIISKEVDEAKKKLQAHVDKEVQKHRTELEKLVQEKQAYLEKEMQKYENMLQEKIAMIEKKKKEIEARIDEEKKKKTDKLKDKVKKQLDNIFP